MREIGVRYSGGTVMKETGGPVLGRHRNEGDCGTGTWEAQLMRETWDQYWGGTASEEDCGTGTGEAQ
jgi:hypothetical protein